MSDSEEYQDLGKGINDTFLREIRDKIDSSWRCQRQLERCNMLAVQSGDPIKNIEFENSVEALMGDLPKKIKEAVFAREGEYIVHPEPRLQYMKAGRYSMGTLENPVIDEETGAIISPTWVTDPPYIDSMLKLSIIKEELESGGASWQYTKILREEVKESQAIPEPQAKEIKDAIRDLVIKHRQFGVMYSWEELMTFLQKTKLETPTLQKEGLKDAKV